MYKCGLNMRHKLWYKKLESGKSTKPLSKLL